MGRRTSLYLTDGLAAAVEKSGMALADLVRRGLEATAKSDVVPARTHAGVPQADATAGPPVVVHQAPAVPESDVRDAPIVVPPQPPAAPESSRWHCDSCGQLMTRPGAGRCEG